MTTVYVCFACVSPQGQAVGRKGLLFDRERLLAPSLICDLLTCTRDVMPSITGGTLYVHCKTDFIMRYLKLFKLISFFYQFLHE